MTHLSLFFAPGLVALIVLAALLHEFHGRPRPRTEADKRAMALLRSWLTPDQEKQWDARGAFEDPAFLSRFARLRLDLYDLGSAFERYAKVLRAGGELGADVSALKIFTTELYQRITEEMLNVAGEEARLADDLAAGDVEIDAMNLFLDSRSPAIFGGSNEIQRNILAKAVLQLPG